MSELSNEKQIEIDPVKKEKLEEAEIDKCPVCLQKFSSIKSKSYTSVCFHSFCFECILEWSKIRYNCPLCKTEFDRIIYDLISRLEYKTYFLKQKEHETNTELEIIQISPNKPFQSNVTYSKASWLLNHEQAPVQFRMLIYINKWYVNPNQIQIDVNITNIDLEFNESQDNNNNKKEIILSDNLPCLSYKPSNRFRNTDPDWFDKNPACTHRIIQFLYRELKALSGILPSNSTERLKHSMRSQLITIIIKLMKKYEIDSEEFFDEISEYIRPLKYARHFQHELSSYAKSISVDLIEYDAKSVYYNDLNSIPKLNEYLKDNPKIIPFNSLPVNLNKYRLLKRESTLSNYYDEFESLQQNLIQETMPTTSRLVRDNTEIIERDESDNRSESEYSSYCEIVTPPRKKTPPLLTISSSSDIEISLSEDKARSSRDTEKTLIKRLRKTSESSKSRERRRHKRHKNSKKSKKSKKKKKKYKSRKSMSRSRAKTRTKSRSYSRSRSRS